MVGCPDASEVPLPSTGRGCPGTLRESLKHPETVPPHFEDLQRSTNLNHLNMNESE